MEMHQVRYFLAVARTLNFTRAAEECNVAQPTLTRAIRQLEEEFGGDLFRRERPHAKLTDLGQRMVPLIQQCYDSALGARSLASSIKSGEVATLRVALSETVDLAILIPYVDELRKHHKHLELKLLRGTADDAAECLKEGEAELAIASSLRDTWERLDKWPLYTESFELIANDSARMSPGATPHRSTCSSRLSSEPVYARLYRADAIDPAQRTEGNYPWAGTLLFTALAGDSIQPRPSAVLAFAPCPLTWPIANGYCFYQPLLFPLDRSSG
jgi:DNA-binding transcriptional LysR family regulator